MLAHYPEKYLTEGEEHLKRNEKQTGSHLLTTWLWPHLNWCPSAEGCDPKTSANKGRTSLL